MTTEILCAVSSEIFLSYSDRDCTIADSLAEAIDGALGSHACFLAKRSIDSGEDWFGRVIEGLDEAKVLVLLLTPASITSLWGTFELGYARARNLKLVLLGFGVTASDLEGSPHSHFQLSTVTDLAAAVAIVATSLNRHHEFPLGASLPLDHRANEHLRQLREEYHGLRAVKAAGVVSVHAAWKAYAPEQFVVTQRRLWILLKDGYSFFRSDARRKQLISRFKDQRLQTCILIVHPDFEHLAAVESMDSAKVSRKAQRRDCLAAIDAMQGIRKELLADGVDIAASTNVEFVGYHKVPTWTGYVGDDIAYVSHYFTRTDRSDLNTIVAKRTDAGGAPLDYFAEMMKDLDKIHRDERHEPSLWSYERD